MKCLRIDNNKGWYSIDETNWAEIDKINKEDLLILLNLAINGEFTMDEYSEKDIANEAHKIIYSNIYYKFKELLKNKNQFKDTSENMYKDAIEKYSKKN